MPRYDLMHWSVRQRDAQAARSAVPVYTPMAQPVSPPRSPKPRTPRPKPVPDPVADELLALCAAGRLYEVEAWIAAGRPLSVPADYKRTPLDVAQQTGFHSLVELLLRHLPGQAQKDRVLVRACDEGQADLVELALRSGADAKAVSFANALLTYDRRLVALLLAHGADPVRDVPFARAFRTRVRPLLGIYLDARRDRPECAVGLQAQLDLALRQACDDGTVMSISLLRWAGADPRTTGRTTEELDDPDFETEPGRSALEIATWRSVDVLKALKVDPARDDLNALMRAASGLFAKPDVLAYLMKLGASPNDKPNGGSTALDSCLSYVREDAWPHAPYTRRRVVRLSELTTWHGTIRSLVGRGACWCPDARNILDVRRALYPLEPSALAATIELLRSHQAVEESVLRELLRTPKMQMQLRAAARAQDQTARRPPQPATRRAPVAPPVIAPTPPRQRFYAGFTRERLYEEVWQEPTREVAKRHGVSDVMVAKACRALEVPKPPRGHWAKKAAGLPVPAQPRLPE